MPQTLTFRDFRVADAKLLAAWLVDSGMQTPPGVSSAVWARRLIDDPHIHCWAAHCPGVGCVGFFRLDIGPDRRGEVTLLVDPKRRGAGLGHNLVEESLRQCRRHGLRELLAMVKIDNERAIALFGAHGFEESGPPVDGFLRLQRLIHRADWQPPLEIQA